MVSEPLFSIYFVGDTEVDELLEEPQEVMTKEERRKMMNMCFIRWNYSRRETMKQVDKQPHFIIIMRLEV